MEFISNGSSSDDDDTSLQHLFKSNIMKMNNNDDYFDDRRMTMLKFCQFSSSHCSQGKLNGSIDSLLGLIMSRNYNMRICLQEHIECHLKPLEHL